MSLYTLQQSINWAKTFIEYSPLTAGTGFEPSASTASMIRSTITNAPFSWSWNRSENSVTSTVQGQQDYTVSIPSFGFLEKASLYNATSSRYHEITNVLNTDALSQDQNQSRAVNISVIGITIGTSVKFRLTPVPDQVYTLYLTYQNRIPSFGPYVITAVGAASGSNTTYTGLFDPLSFPTAAIATMVGCTTPANNGAFVVVSCSGTSLVVANAGGVAESETAASAQNLAWIIPDSFIDVYNALFMAEAYANVDDNRSQAYRSRGVAALLGKAQGLTDMQRNVFMSTYLGQNASSIAVGIKAQQGQQARSV